MTSTDVNFSSPWDEFTGESLNYNASRPGYPVGVAELLVSRAARPTSTDIVVDVGCGTGIFTRSLAKSFGKNCHIYGVDPNAEMIEVAKSLSDPVEVTDYVLGSGEVIPFEDESCIAVTAATAAHRFERPKFYSEARRLLRPGGVLAIITTSHDFENSEFVREYHGFLEFALPGYKTGFLTNSSLSYSAVDFVEELSLFDKSFRAPSRTVWKWKYIVNYHNFIALSRSSSLVQRSIAISGEHSVLSFLTTLFQQHQKDSAVTIGYSTEAVMATRREAHR